MVIITISAKNNGFTINLTSIFYDLFLNVYIYDSNQLKHNNMKKIIFIILTLMCLATPSLFAQNNYIGEIKMVPFNFAPAGWALCNGQLLPINQNQALFSLLGTTYGGDGQTTFALPDMRGRIPMHSGQGPGLTDRLLGEAAGSETNTLDVTQLPAHSHSVAAVTTDGDTNLPTAALSANTKILDKEYSSAAANATMNPSMIGSTGGSQPVNNIQPFMCVNFIIALQGIYPPQN